MHGRTRMQVFSFYAKYGQLMLRFICLIRRSVSMSGDENRLYLIPHARQNTDRVQIIVARYNPILII